MVLFLVVILLIIFIIYYAFTMPFPSSPLVLFNKLVKAKNFSNVNKIYSYNDFMIFQADNDGENFLFGLRSSGAQFSTSDLNILYDQSKKRHTHSNVLISMYPIAPNTAVYKKIKDYGIDVWTTDRINNLIYGDLGDYHNNSVLKTSDVSGDTCDIDTDSNDPIKDGTFNTHGLFSIFRNKTEHL